MAEYLDINGVHTWFDEVGDGDPAVLLHGGLTDSQEFALTTPALAAEFHTYLPERRGHGHTPDVDGPFSYDLMADDTIAFLEATIERAAHLVGHSDGANVALLVALKRPDLVRRLVLISANFHHDGLVPGAIVVDHVMGMVANQYAAVSPDGAEHLPIVGAKVARMFAEEPTLTVADLAGVRARTLVMCADDDAVTLEHTVALYRGIPRSELAVVPGTSHVLVLEKPELCNKLIVDFLTTDAPPTFWPLRRLDLLHDPAGYAHGAGAGRVATPGNGVGVRHAHLALEAVGVAEEEAEDRAEVGDELVGRAPGDEPVADLLERLERRGLQRQVVEPAPPEHRRLAVGLGVADHLEHVELRVRADVDDRHAHLAGVLAGGQPVVSPTSALEHLGVERVQPVGVVGEDGHVVEPVGEHRSHLRVG